MGIGHTRSHVEAEFKVEIELLVSKLEDSASSLDGDLLLKERVEHGVNFVLDVLNEDRRSFLKRELEAISQVRVSKGVNVSTFLKLLLTVFNPSDSLTLRINHEGVSG